MQDLSTNFMRMWAKAQARSRVYVLHHPVVGELTLHGELFILPDKLSYFGIDLFAIEPALPSEQALRKLVSR